MRMQHFNGKKGLVPVLFTLAFCRFVMNMSRRFAYPFAPAISRGLDVPLTSVTTVLAFNQAAGLFGILFGPVIDRAGYVPMMYLGLFVMMTGMALVSFFPVYAVVFAALVLAGIGKIMLDPSVEAYVGTHVDFSKRARVVGLLEISWAATTLLGLPLMGMVISGYGWTAGFQMLLVLGALAVLALWKTTQEEERKKEPRTPGIPLSDQLLLFLKRLFSMFYQKHAFALLFSCMCVCFANDILFVVYGVWFETSFGFSVLEIGFSAGVLGVAELLGEFLVVLFSDRTGVSRSVSLGLFFTALAYAGMPFFAHSLFPALGAVFLVFVLFEFTIVSLLSLATEAMPEARGTLLSAFFAFAGLGRVMGVFIGGIAWEKGGITLISMYAAGANLLALVVFLPAATLFLTTHWKTNTKDPEK